MTPDERIDELEMRLAFQEQILSQLNEVVVEQRRELDQLRLRLDRALADLGGIRGMMEADTASEPPPPHY